MPSKDQRSALESSVLGAGPWSDPRLSALIGPGAPYEIEELVLDGVPLRDFVRAPRTIVDIFEMGSAHEALVHLVHGQERWTFGEVSRHARLLARQLRSTFGVRPGDRVAISMRNLPEFVVSFWGAALCGAIVVPLNSWWVGAELAYALEDADVTVAFLDGERAERLRSIGRPASLVVIGVRDAATDVALDDLLAGAEIDGDEVARLDRDDPVTLLYTSGTTGRPKGALSTNRASIASLWNMGLASQREAIISGRRPAAPGQRAMLNSAPLFHIGGIAAIIGAPMIGSKLVLMQKWDLNEALRLAREEHVTSLGGVPAVARQILEHPGVAELDLHPYTWTMGGAAVPPDLPAKAVDLFGDELQVMNGYGLTETTSAVVANLGVEFLAHPDSVGRAHLTTDLHIVGPDGEVLGVDQVGEICVRSPQVALGYWRDVIATGASFVDGWFHTGDVGYIDGEGFLYVVDRMKDVVIRGGENVYSAEVEAVLHDHPGIAQAAIVAIEEGTLGERVCAVVVARERDELTLAEVRRFVAPRLAAFKCPEALLVVAELPMTATGKVAKNVLREQVAKATAELERGW